MRWHGTTIGIGLRFSAPPTARAARGLPIRWRERRRRCRRAPYGTRASSVEHQPLKVGQAARGRRRGRSPGARPRSTRRARGARRSTGAAERSTRAPNGPASSSSSRSGSGSNEMRQSPRSVAATSSGPIGRVGQVVGDVEQALRGGAPRGSGDRARRERRSCALLLRSRRTPDEAAWRAASSLEPSACADVGVGEVVAVAQDDRRSFGRRAARRPGARARRRQGARRSTAISAGSSAGTRRAGARRSRRASRS